MNDRYLKLLNITNAMRDLIIDHANDDFNLFLKLATEQLPLFDGLVDKPESIDQDIVNDDRLRLDISDFEFREGLNHYEIEQVKQMLITILSDHPNASKKEVYDDMKDAISHKSSWSWLVNKYPSLKVKVPTIDRNQQRIPGTPIRNVGIAPSQEMIDEERLEISNKKKIQDADYEKRRQEFIASKGREPQSWEVYKQFDSLPDPEKINIQYSITQQEYESYTDDIINLYHEAEELSTYISNMHDEDSAKEPYTDIANIEYSTAVQSFKTVDDIINDLSARVKNLVYKIAVGSLGYSLFGALGRQDKRRYGKSSPRILSEQDHEWLKDIEQLKIFIEEVPKYSDINAGFHTQFHTRDIGEWFKIKKNVLTEYIKRLEYTKASYEKSLRFYKQLDRKLHSLINDRINSTIPKEYIDVMQTTPLFDKIKDVYIDINKKLFGIGHAAKYYSGVLHSVEEKMYDEKSMSSVTEYLVFSMASVVSDIYNEIVRCMIDPVYVQVNRISIDKYINEELGMSDAEMESLRNPYGKPVFNIGSEYTTKFGNAILRVADSNTLNMKSMLQFGKFIFANKDDGQNIAKHLEEAALERIAYAGLEKLYGDVIYYLQNILPTLKFPLDAFKEIIMDSNGKNIDDVKYGANSLLINKFFEVHKDEIFKRITEFLRGSQYTFTYNQQTTDLIFNGKLPQRFLELSKLIDEEYSNAYRKIGSYAVKSINSRILHYNRESSNVTAGVFLAASCLTERRHHALGFTTARWIKNLLDDSLDSVDILLSNLRRSINTQFFHSISDDDYIVISYADFCEDRLQDLLAAASDYNKIKHHFGIPMSKRMMEFYKEDYLKDESAAIENMNSFILKIYDHKMQEGDDFSVLEKQKIINDNFKMGLHYAEVAYEQLAEYCDKIRELGASVARYNEVKKPELKKVMYENVYTNVYNTRMSAFGAVGPRAIASKYSELEKLKHFSGLPMVAFGKLLEGQFHIDASSAIDSFLNDSNMDLENSIFKLNDMASNFYTRENALFEQINIDTYIFGITAQMTGISDPRELFSLYERVKKLLSTEADNIGKREVDLIFPSIFSDGNISKLPLAIRLASLMHNSGANVPQKVFLSIARNPNFEHWGSRNVLDNYFNSYIKIYSFGGYSKFVEENKQTIDRLESSKVIDKGFRSKVKRFIALVNSGEIVNPSSTNFSELKQLIDSVEYGLNAIKESATFAEFDKKVVKKDDALFKLNWSPSGANFRFRVLQTFDPYHFKVGLDTNCCQKLGGVGENAAIDSYINPLAGVILLEIKDDGGWKTAAQSYFHYVPSQNGYILDNVEKSSHAKSIYSVTNNTLDELYAIWADHIKNTINPKYILVGLNYTKIDEDKFKKYKMNGDPRMFAHAKYTDWRPSSSANLLTPKFKVESKFLKDNDIEKVSALDLRYLYLKNISINITKDIGDV